MAKLYVIQDRYNEEITEWYIYTNEESAQKKFDELDEEYDGEWEDWQIETLDVSGPQCGFLIGFDDYEGKVFAKPVKDVRKFELDTDFSYKDTTAYLIGPKSKEGKIIVTSYGDLEASGKLQKLAYWSQSELEESYSGNDLKHVKMFESFIKSLKK